MSIPALSNTEAALAKQASFGNDIAAQREAATALSDMQYGDTDKDKIPVQADVAEAPSWDEAVKAEKLKEDASPPTWEEAKQLEQARVDKKRLTDKEVLANLPDNINVFGLDVPAPKGTVAFAVATGESMTWAYRGLKQLWGVDEASMAAEKRLMDKLYDVEGSVGNMATAGQVYGAVFEPAGMLVGAVKAKKVSVAVAKGFGLGSAYGSIGYVDKEAGQTRLGNTLLGGSIAGTFSGFFSGITIRATNKLVARHAQDLKDLEVQMAQNVLQDIPAVDAMQVMRKGFSLVTSTAVIGRKVKVPMNKKQAEEVIEFYRGTTKQSNLAIGADNLVGIVSTRIGNASEALKGRLRDHDFNVSTNQHKMFERVDPFLQILRNSFNKGTRDQISKSLLDGDFATARVLLAETGGSKAVPALDNALEAVDELGDQLVSLGIIEGKLENYWPRFISDHKAMLGKLGREEKVAVENAIDKAQAKAANAGKELSAIDESDIVNKVLRGYKPIESGGGPFTKKRSYKKIPSILREFYSSPEESLHSYVRNSINDIEKAKFFGKNLKQIKTGTATMFNVDKSVGSFMIKQQKLTPMTRDQLKEVSTLLRIRFGVGEMSPPKLIQDAKNILYLSLLANPFSAAVQLGDLFISTYVNGFRNTLQALVTKNKVDVKDWGLVDQLAEEFATTSSTARLLRRGLKVSGFATVDKLGKNTHVNAAFIKARRQVKSAKGEAAFRKENGEYLGDKIDNVIKGLKSGTVNDDTAVYLFGKLADVQPISLSEVPAAYLNNPKLRIAYMLKTFMLKQVDILRRDAYSEIKKGNTAKGLYNGARYALYMGGGGTASAIIKDIMMYGPTDEQIPIPEWEDIPLEFGKNLFKTFAYSEYIENKFKEGKPVEALTDMFAPPFEIVDKIISQDPEWKNYMPIYGRAYNMWFNGGAKRAVERKQKREKEKYMKEMLGEEISDLRKKRKEMIDEL